MKVLIANVKNLDSPEITLIYSLLRHGADITVAGYDLNNLPRQICESKKVEIVDYGTRSSKIDRVLQNRRVRSHLRKLCQNPDFDYVWTTNEITVRDIGKRLFSCNHIMQLYELCEYVPRFGRRAMPFHDKKTIEIARKASCVIVPEYNRACIQRLWWNLPTTPVVLPNKPQIEGEPSPEAELRARHFFSRVDRKVLLYQGIIAPERDLEPFARSLRYLDDEFILCVMGDISTNWQKEYLDNLQSIDDRVKYIGHEKTPDHLAYTKYGYIGVLVYVPQKVEYISPLNGLYCAPNKIWEYSRVGLPMVSNDLPGLSSIFRESGIGIATSMEPKNIADAIRRVDVLYSEMSRKTLRYYNSIDIDSIVSSIIGL